MEKLLECLGVGLIKRKAIGHATITQTLKHYKDEQGVEHIEIQGKNGKASIRVLDWKEVEREEPLFGEVLIKTQRSDKVDSFANAQLTEGWTADTFEFGVVHSSLKSDTAKTGKTWFADQVCPFTSSFTRFLLTQRVVDLGLFHD